MKILAKIDNHSVKTVLTRICRIARGVPGDTYINPDRNQLCHVVTARYLRDYGKNLDIIVLLGSKKTVMHSMVINSKGKSLADSYGEYLKPGEGLDILASVYRWMEEDTPHEYHVLDLKSFGDLHCDEYT